MDRSYLTYEDYDAASDFYDGTRSALGVDIILGMLAIRIGTLSELSVLDIGCGTGNYLATLAPHLKEMVGLEYSQGMLLRARAKTKTLDSVRLARGSAFSLPFPRQRFDAVLLIQVAHHFDVFDGIDDGSPGESLTNSESVTAIGASVNALDDDHVEREDDTYIDERRRFPKLQQALAQARDVLRPGGLLIISHSMQHQMHDAYWWADLIPEAMTRIAQRFISRPALEQMVRDIGLEYGGAIVPLDEVLQARNYLNIEGPMSEHWRSGDSTWTLATRQELNIGLIRLRSMIADGSVFGWIKQRERLRREVGQAVFVWARRPAL